MSYTLIYEDNHLLVVNKMPGILVQPDKAGDISLEVILKDYLREKYGKPGEVFLGVTHRLDRPVSGLVIFAKTSKALVRMNEIFRERQIEKTYWAVTAQKPEPESGKLIHWLTRNESKNMSKAHATEVKNSLKAELEYKLLQQSDRYNLLEIKLLTGRHHQIRTQISAIGCPIVGDLKYGFARSSPDGSIFLHSRQAKFIHPVRQAEMVLEAPEPVLWQKFGLNLF
jgi:23S rRNA pseudouridine1911/1915/1917 synthase